MDFIIFNVTATIWILSEIFLNRFLRSGNSGKQSVDKNSELYIWLTIIVSVFIGVFVSRMFFIPLFSNAVYSYAGIGLIYLGIIIRFTAIRQLGKFFTVDVAIRKDHQLIQSGFYKYLRHPSYFGSLISFLGFGISLNSWLGLPIVFIPVLISFVYRINVEENVLIKQFGEHYTDYCKKTKRIIPFIY